MTTLAEMMLDVARFVTIVSEGAATSGSTTTLLDTVNLTEPGDYWGKGTLIIKSATQTDLNSSIIPVLQFGENKLTFSALSKTITAGDTYGVIYSEYKALELKNAVLGVLRSRNAQLYDTSLTGNGSTEYDLPTGVKGVRRVEIDGAIDQHWHEVNGQLVWPTKYAPASGTIQITYCTPQGTIANSASIDDSYDYDAVKWSAIVNVLRAMMQKIGKDDPVLMDLLNEAKTEEQKAWGRAKRHINTDMRLA